MNNENSSVGIETKSNEKNFLKIAYIGVILTIIAEFLPLVRVGIDHGSFTSTVVNTFQSGGIFLIIICALVILFVKFKNHWCVVACGVIEFFITRGMVKHAIDSWSLGINASNGSTVGGLLGSVVPGIGNALGAIGGGIVGGLLEHEKKGIDPLIGLYLLFLSVLIIIISGLLEFKKSRKCTIKK